jgi:sugar lactone lactonase YvrE
VHRLLAALTATATLGMTAVAGAAPFPDRLDLPDGWQPEGIASGKGNELFVGSIPTGDIWRFNARTGAGSLAVDAPEGSAAVGIEADQKRRLFVAGGPTGAGYVYDTRTGERLASYQFRPAGSDTFINDVTLTNRYAYFTDSRNAVLYRVDARRPRADRFETIALTGVTFGAGFNFNGIEDARGGRILLAVQSNTGTLWRIDAQSGRATAVDLGGELLTNGDGLLLSGRRLYVVQNRLNRIAVVRLSGDLRAGTIVDRITSGDFSVPTTVARIGDRLYAVNARFGTPPTPATDYWVTQIER